MDYVIIPSWRLGGGSYSVASAWQSNEGIKSGVYSFGLFDRY
ncbi:MAG TPA: hypothetical protein VN519_15995 [Bryobacteraceae bacterium]|nr:hypothetical protein [Bryobacteraceae bacterium]